MLLDVTGHASTTNLPRNSVSDRCPPIVGDREGWRGGAHRDAWLLRDGTKSRDD
jgi:hypothetical protein